MKRKLSFDYFLLLITGLLVVIGLVAIFSASAPYSYIGKESSYAYLKNQLKWLVIGIFFLFFAAKFNYHWYQKLDRIIILLVLFSLCVVYLPGVGRQIRGTYRWIDLKSFHFQPSEFAKIGLIIYLSSSLVRKKDKLNSFINGFLPFFIIISFIFLLVVMEPDLSSAMIIAIVGFAVLYAGGVKVSHMFYAILLAAIPLYFSIFGVGYRKGRITAFLHPERYPQGIGFQLIHSKISLGVGGLWGLGPGKGREKLFYLPTPHTDSIFAVIGEELGFVGTSLIVVLFFLMAVRGLKIVRKAPDDLGKLLALGLTFLICFQAVINMGVATVIFPTTGATLPFISYGGSSLIVCLTAVGILLNISRERLRGKRDERENVRSGSKGKGES